MQMEAVATPVGVPSRYLNWTPAILGALVATALSSILVAFGATVGLGISSTAPTWRDASAALWLLSGLYLIIQAALSFGVGGYIAGRTSVGLAAADAAEVEHRDGLHGLAAWALAVVLRCPPCGAAWKRNSVTVEQQHGLLADQCSGALFEL